MKKILGGLCLLILCVSFSSCQGFFEDYAYSPVGGGVNSNSY